MRINAIIKSKRIFLKVVVHNILVRPGLVLDTNPFLVLGLDLVFLYLKTILTTPVCGDDTGCWFSVAVTRSG